jgi:hypothetical protein
MNLKPSFNATELSAFVRTMGWVQVEEAVKDGLYVFNHPDFAPLQLVFAMRENFRDADETLLRVANRLAQIYEWSPVEAVRKIEESNHDVVVSRVPDERHRKATVSLLYASKVLESQKQLLLSGAAASNKRQAFYHRTNVGNGKKLLEAARFRHTEEGSFIFKASCSLYAVDGDNTLSLFSAENEPSPEPFVRRAMLNIETGLQDLVRSIRDRKEDRLVEDIKERASSPVSSNFCEAVAELRDREHPHAIDLSINWSPLLALPPGTPRRTIRIKPDDFPTIEKIGKALEPADKPTRDTYLGTVEKLSGTFNTYGQREGQVILSLFFKEERIKVRLVLDAPQYDEAVAVHRTTKVLVRITGTIKPKHRQPYGFDLVKFEIMNAQTPTQKP